MTENTNRSANIVIKFTEQQKELMTKLAKDTGVTVSAAVANAVQISCAKRVRDIRDG